MRAIVRITGLPLSGHAPRSHSLVKMDVGPHFGQQIPSQQGIWVFKKGHEGVGYPSLRYDH